MWYSSFSVWLHSVWQFLDPLDLFSDLLYTKVCEIYLQLFGDCCLCSFTFYSGECLKLTFLAIRWHESVFTPVRWGKCFLLCFLSFFFFLLFWTAHGLFLVPPQGIEPAAPALQVQSRNHWTAREVLLSLLKHYLLAHKYIIRSVNEMWTSTSKTLQIVSPYKYCSVSSLFILHVYYRKFFLFLFCFPSWNWEHIKGKAVCGLVLRL